jgi:hypothetical protein
MNVDTAVIDQSPLDLALPVALRKGSRNRKLPQRYLDILPCTLPCAAPRFPSQEPLIPPDLDAVCHPVRVETPHVLDSCAPVHSASSAPNIFGLTRKYHGDRFPDHDAEDHLTFGDLCNRNPTPPQPADPVVSERTFLPYPNESSFALGHWYWNEGQQKTLSGFQKLIEIVGNPSFLPSDVLHTDWSQINSLLADPQVEKGDNDAEWMDAADEGWHITEIKISVPFHRNSREPGTKIYRAASLYHRSLIAVMRERVADPHDFRYFHIEPYQLLWSSPLNPGQAIHVHGELYTSESFLRAHVELQQSTGEPGCQLTRVICAFMFWSDETHLTSFGSTKLWPIYAFFGNESKYRRGKPSCNSCNHVAYLEKVRYTPPPSL